jgi:hypothetical protein
MIKHIVVFKLKEFAEGKTKKENVLIIKDILECLPAKIEEIKKFEVGINITVSERAADLILISEFDDIEALNRYIINPEHKKAAEFILKVREESKIVDFEVA